jgi:hypothetical protein
MTMNDQEGVREFQLDCLTQGVRFVAGVWPRTATRVGLGVALALEDSATDPCAELLGVKLGQGATALASTIGSIASCVRDGVRSNAERLNVSDGPLSKVPALETARGFVTSAATEFKDAWIAAGYVPVQVEEPQAPEAPAPKLASDDSSSSTAVNPVTETEGAES